MTTKQKFTDLDALEHILGIDKDAEKRKRQAERIQRKRKWLATTPRSQT